MNFLRDPIWQALGVIVAIITIFVSLNTAEITGSGELAVAHYQKIRFSQYGLPPERIKLLVRGSKQELDNAVADYFVIFNHSKKPILISDYMTPLEVTKSPTSKRLIFVESCSSGALNPQMTAMEFSWQVKGDKWIAQPALLNPGDYSCVVAISEENPAIEANKREPLRWAARIVNVKLKYYSSYAEYAKSIKTWEDYLGVSVTLEGIAPFWFLLLQATLFLATTSLALRAGLKIESRWGPLISLVTLSLLSISTAEILVDIVINRRNEDLHPIAYPMLFVHAGLCVYLTWRAFKRPIPNRDRPD